MAGYCGATEEINFGAFTFPPILVGPAGRISGDGSDAAFDDAMPARLPASDALAYGSIEGAESDWPSFPRVEVVGRAVSALDIISVVTLEAGCFAGTVE